MKNFLNTKIKDKKAITLIALVITIVVLIILAAVAINLSLGNNGIFNRAKTAKEKYQNAEIDEHEKIDKTSNVIDSIVKNSVRENEGFDLTSLNDFIELASVFEKKPNSSYTLSEEYSMVIVSVNSIGTGSGSDLASSVINVQNNSKPVITLLSGDMQGYSNNQYKISASLIYMINPDVGTQINYSSNYYGKVHIYALNKSAS